jgi:ketosteroid isomerase-like protein
MHSNGELLQRLFTALDQRDHPTMAGCYHEAATFRDIAFDLKGRPRIHGMWQMICEKSDIRATFDVLEADDRQGRVALVDRYTFSDTKFRVLNVIDAWFRFRDGLIIEHRDHCDPRVWAEMAVHGGVVGFLAGHFRPVRSMAARRKLKAFLSTRRTEQLAGGVRARTLSPD